MGNSQSRRIFFSLIASLVALFCVVATPVFAESGINRQINYQGRLLTSGGQSVTDGTYLLKLSLYDAASSGNRLWTAAGSTSTPTAVNVTVTNGLFSVQLGDASAGQNPLDIDFYQNSIYLGVTVASDTEMLPRKRLTAVPYAFVAETLQGQYASSAVATTGGNLFTLQQTSTSAATADRTALFVRTSGTSNQFDYLIKAHSGSDVFTVSRQGNVTTTGNFASAGNVIVGDSSGDALIVNASLNSNIVPLTNNAFDLGSSSLSFANIYASGTLSTLRGLSFTSATGTNATTTSFAATVICLTGDTCRTSWPTSSGSSDSNWTFSSTNSMVYLATTSHDLVIGASASASAPFYFDVGQPTSSFQIGRVGNANLFVGTSTYNGSFNGPFSPNGDDAFIRGDLGVLGIGYFGTVTSSLVYGDIGLFGSATATRQFCIGNLASQCIDAPNSGQLRTTGTFRSDGPFLPLSGISSLGGDILPAATNLRSLGSASLSMLNIYASGTVVVGTNVTVGGQSVCLANGTNCPASSGTNYWGYNATNDTLYPASTTVDVLIGGATVSSTPFRFLTQTTSSRLFVGSFGSSTDIVVGNPTSTISNSLFQLSGGSLFALSNIGSASSIYTNAAVVISTGTILGDGFLNRINGSINVSSSQDVTFTMSSNLGVGTSTPSEKLTVVGNIQNTLVGGQSFTIISSSTYRNLDNPTGILINENFGYVAQGGASTPLRIHIFDFENPAYPTSVSSLLLADTSGGGDVFTMALSGRYLYVPGQASNTVYIVDVSNARLPTLISSISVTAPVEALTQGRFLFIRTTNSIRVYDLSDPTNPTLVRIVSGSLSGGKTTIYKNILYAANSSNSVIVYDITNPAMPASLGQVSVGSSIRPIYAQDGFLYIGAASEFDIYNVMNPRSSFQTAQPTISGTPSSLIVSGRYAFLTQPGGLAVYDVSSSTSPIALQTITGFGQGASSTAIVAGQYVVATNVAGDSIIVVKIPGVETSSLTAHMMQAGSLSVRTDAAIANQLVVGGGLQIGNGGFISDGSFSVNATNTTSTIRYTLSISGTTTMAGDSVTLGNGFVTTGTFGVGTSTSPDRLTVVGNVKNTIVQSQPLTIVSSTTFPTLENPTGLLIDGKNMYLAQKGGNTAFIFRVMDISNPAYPTSVGSLQLSQTAGNNNYFSMAQSGKYVYVPGQASNTVYIVDVSYPALPTLASSFSVTAPLQVLSQGHYLYIRKSTTIDIYDIANPLSPTLIRSFTAGSTGPIVLSKNFLYSARTTGNVIEVYDIRDPYFASNVATISAGGNVHAMAVQDGFLYAGMAGEVRVFNVKNPLVASQVEQDSTLSGNPFSASVSGRYFVVSHTGGYQLYDVASSTSIIPLQTVTGFGTAASSTVINGKYLYSTYSAGETITVTDLSGIETTGLLAHSADVGSLTVQTDASIANQLIVGGALQIGSGGFISDGSFAVNATNTTSTFAGTVTVQGRLLCLADGTNCPASGSASDDWFYDATADTIRPSTTTSDVLIGAADAANAPFRFLTQTTSSRLFVGVNGSSTDIVVGGTTSTITNSAFQLNGGSIFAAGSIAASSSIFTNGSLYVSGTIQFAYASGSALDLNIKNAFSEATTTISGGANDIAVSGRYAYIAGGTTSTGLTIVDIADPLYPQTVTTVNAGVIGRGVAVAGKNVYLAASLGLAILDVSNPSAPSSVASFATGAEGANDVIVSGKYAYLSVARGEAFVLDISNPFTPTSVARITLQVGTAGKMFLHNTYLYIANGANGTEVYDVADPRKPAYIAVISSAGDVPYAPYVSGRYAYTAEGGEGLQITDISNPNSPVVKSLIGAGTGLSYDVTVAGKYAYVSTDGGVAVMDVASSTAPTAVTLSGGYGRANAVAVAGKYAYVAHTTGMTVVDMQGAEISAANIGSVWANTLTVLDSVDIGNSVNIRNSLSVGAGGILSDGPIVASELNIAAVRSVSLKSSVSIPNGDTLFGIAVSGRYAYISTNSTSLRILDITNPASPSSVGTLANASSGRAVAVSGKYAYLTENNGSNPLFRVVDISNPFAPTTTGVIGGLSVNVGQVVVHGTYVYVGDSNNGVRVIDVSNPRNPRIVATVKTAANTQNELYIQSSYLYIAEGTTDLEILDISNPMSPTSVGVLAESSSSTQSVVVAGRYAYVGYGNEGVKVIDVKDPTAPVVVSTYNTAGNAAGLKLVGSYLLVADTNGMVALDVSNPADPRFVSQYYGNFSTVKKLVVSGKYAYTGDTSNASAAFGILDLQGADIAAANIGTLQAGSIQVLDSLDVANLANIRNALTVGPGGILSEGLISARGVSVDSFEYVSSVGRLTPGGGIDYDTIDVQGRFAYLTDSSNNLAYVIDVSNPAAPTSVASATLSANGESLAVAGRYAYVANGTGASALEVVDISTPNSPRLVGTMASASSVQSLHVEGSYAYAAAAGQGVRVIDISDPIAPTTVGMVGLGSNVNALDLYVQGRYAYVIGGTGSMYVVDVNTSSRPVIVGSLGISSARYVRASGRYAYVAGSDNTMSVIDVQNPAVPTQVATTTLNGTSPFIAISGRYVFAALGSQGLQILDITTPTAPTSVRYLPSLMDGNFCSEIQIVGRYLYGACTSGFYVVDLGGADVTTLRAGSLESTDVSILDRLSVANRIEVGGGITVGMNGVHTDGELSGRTLRAIDNEGTATGSAGIFFKSVTGTAGTAYQFTGLTSFTTGTGGSLDALPDLNRFTFGTAVQSAAAFVANGFSNTLGNNAVGLLAVDMTSSTTGGAIFAARACGDAVNGNIMKLSTDTDTSRFTFRCNGQLFTDNGTSGNPADYAEFFPTNDTSLTAGEVVALSDDAVTTVRRAMLGDREHVLGVISANPLILGNAGPDGANENNPYFKKVGLLGQLITRVSDSNGQIRAGDKVTVGDNGFAVKASGVGMVLGYAMEHLTTATGTIRVYVNPTWSGDGIFEASTSTTNVLPQGIATASSTVFDSYGLTFEGSVWSASSNTAFVSSFTLVNNVISASSSLFRINGTNGTALLTISDVGDVSVTGDLTVGRRLFLGSKNTGEGSTSTYIFVDDTQAPSSTYIATNADGWSTSSTYDYAERFPSAETLSAGDVVTTDPTDINHVKRSSTVNDIILGIVSTKPGFITGAYASGTYPIALAGRVPTRVSTMNGPIVAGDQLAPSNEPGVAVKAISSGPIIGIALEGYDAPTEGKISVFVQPGWKGGEIVSDAQSAPSTIVYQTQTFDPGVSPRAGLARISAGSVSVDVSFASIQAYPLLTVSPYGLPTANWGLINVNDHGFTITLAHPETFDLVFAWKAEPSVSGAVMSFSDGTSAPYDALTGQAIGSPTSSTEPVVPVAPTDTTSTSTDVAGDVGSTTGTALTPDEQVSVSTGTQPGG